MHKSNPNHGSGCQNHPGAGGGGSKTAKPGFGGGGFPTGSLTHEIVIEL